MSIEFYSHTKARNEIKGTVKLVDDFKRNIGDWFSLIEPKNNEKYSCEVACIAFQPVTQKSILDRYIYEEDLK